MSRYSINSLRNMEVIDANKGVKLGYICDFKIDCENYRIISIIIPNNKNSWFGKNNHIEVPWDNIIRIGRDVILVEEEKNYIDKLDSGNF